MDVDKRSDKGAAAAKADTNEDEDGGIQQAGELV